MTIFKKHALPFTENQEQLYICLSVNPKPRVEKCIGEEKEEQRSRTKSECRAKSLREITGLLGLQKPKKRARPNGHHALQRAKSNSH